MTFPSFERVVKGIEFSSMAALLADFRRELEQNNGQSIQGISKTALLFLDDLCNFLGLSPQERRRVLGRAGAAHVACLYAQAQQKH